MIQALVLMLLLSPNRAQAVDICEDPIPTICESSLSENSISDDQITKEVRQHLGDEVKPARLSGDGDKEQAELAQYQKTVGVTYQVILGHFNERGISEVDLVNRISKLKEQAAQDFAQGKLGPSLVESGGLSNAGIAENIRKISYLSPRTLAGLSPSDVQAQETIESYYESCGADGLTDQAFYEPEDNRFILCPGALLQVLNDGGLDVLNQELGHELTHSADAFNDPRNAGQGNDWKEGDAPLYEKYAGFLKCTQANYAGQFSDPRKVIAEMKGPSKDRLKEYLLSLRSEEGDHSSEIAESELNLKKADSLAEELQGLIDTNEKRTGHVMNLADSHAGELTADLGGNVVMREMLRQTPASQRASSIAMAMRTYCPVKMAGSSQALFGDLSDDGLHPPENFRVRNVLNDPEIRLLLGCQSLAGSGPYCEARKGRTIVARCTGAEPHVQDCEKQMSAQLQANGCQFQKIQCEVSATNAVGCVTQSTNCELATSQNDKLICTEKEFPTLLKEGSPIPGLCLATAPVQATRQSGAQ